MYKNLEKSVCTNSFKITADMFCVKNSLSFCINSSGKLLLQPSRQVISKCGKEIMLKNLPSTTVSSVVKGNNANLRMTSTSPIRMGGLPLGRKRATRGHYSQLESDDISFFSNLLGKHRVLTNQDELEGYNVDWLHAIQGYNIKHNGVLKFDAFMVGIYLMLSVKF